MTRRAVIATATRSVPPARTWPWLLFVGTGAFVVSLSHSLLIPVLALLPAELDTSVDTVQWLLTSTLLVAAVSVPLLGRLGDMFGRRRMLLVAVGALIVGSLVIAITDNVPLLIVGRAIQGVAAATIPLGISLLGALLPRERAGTAIAAVSAMLGVGGVLGLPFSGVVAEIFDFHMLFWISAVAACVAFAGIALVVPEAPSHSAGRVDLLGALLLAGVLVSLLLPLAQGSDWGWSSPPVVLLLVQAAVLLLLFGWWQSRATNPLVDLATLRRRPLMLTNTAAFFFGFALFASLIGTAPYVQAPVSSGYGFGSSMVTAGLVMLPSGCCMLVLAPVAARLIAWRGAPQVLALGGIVVALGWVVRITVTGALWHVVLGATVVGVGTGIGYAALPALINRHAPDDETSAANGLNMLARMVGSAVASAVGGSILAAYTMTLGTTPFPSLTAYRVLFAICTAAALLAAVAALLIPSGERRAHGVGGRPPRSVR